MILQLSLSGYEIYGNTFKCKAVFKENRLRWNPQKKCWYGTDFQKIYLIKEQVKKYNEYITVHTKTFRPAPKKITPPNKQYLTKKTNQKAKITALSIMNNIEPELRRKIIETAFPKIYECKCSGERTCSLCYYACCEKAQEVFCVCLCATQCPRHGRRCNGSHD